MFKCFLNNDLKLIGYDKPYIILNWLFYYFGLLSNKVTLLI